ncbi:hypothetical protein O181_090786 [Austropuccinia psidii MF-1]|uniref:Uncharacterized protein n=1 Tax=Austropuccinia psidii MF-1 TaxID=1389203 RepID=A0A9Q3IW88_9BASI|nr:hypothetical protein [Austropuccinia psidii MF-1]
MEFLVFENFNQIIVEERSSISYSSKESILPEPDRKSRGKEPEDEMEVDDREEIAKIKEEPRKMRRNLDRRIEDPEKWLTLELSGINKEYEGERTEKKFKMDLKPPEANVL